MAFTISSNYQTMSCAAGEPIFLALQLTNGQNIAEDLSGRSFVLSFYNNARENEGYYAATVASGWAVWTIDGTDTEKLYVKTPLNWEIAERLDGTDREILMAGVINVTISAPFPVGTDSGAKSRYITRITRKFDVETPDAASFTKSIVLYSTVPAPAFSVQPSISGTAQVGSTLNVTDGTITNGTVAARQWLRAGVAITGATGTSYTLISADVGTQISYRVTATGQGGSTTATSTATAAVTVSAPIFSVQPSISPASATVGATFTANDGTASGSPTLTRRWLMNGTSIGTGTTVTPVVTGSLVLEVTATNSGGSTIATSSAATVASAGPSAKPLAPTIVATGGSNQALLTITDDASSQQVQKWNIYKSSTSNGTYSFLTNAYRKDQVYRRILASGSTEFYKVAAWNALGEGPLSAEVSATANSANFNPLRLIGTTLFANVLFYEPVGPDFKAGSTVSVTSSDGTALSVKTQGGQPLIYGTFTTAGTKTLTFTETTSGGATNTSTQTISVVSRPVAATYADVKPTANAIKARMNAKPTYSDVAINLTDMGTSMPAGYSGDATSRFSNSNAPALVYATLGNFKVPENYINVVTYEPVEKKVIVGSYVANSPTCNTVMRQRLFKQTWIMALADTQQVSFHFKIRYSDDEMQTWKELAQPFYHRVGAKFLKIDPGVAAPTTGRIWEVEFSIYAGLANYSYAPGLGYEAGETPQVVNDTSPVASIYIDSFAAGVGAIDCTKNMGRRAARNLGLLGFWNHGVNSHRYTHAPSVDFPLGLDRIGDNVVGYGDVTTSQRNDILFLNITINDFAQPDYVQAQAMFTNLVLRARRMKPVGLIIVTLGFWSPQDRITTPLYDAIKAAMTDAMNGDKGMRFNDGIAAGWAIATGTTGSSPYFLASNSQNVTGSTSGRTLTITAGSGIELGTYLAIGSTFQRARIVSQIGGTTGGAGTYLLDSPPFAGDIAADTTISLKSEDYASNYPVHPSPAGHLWMGDKLSAAAESLVNEIVAA